MLTEDQRREIRAARDVATRDALAAEPLTRARAADRLARGEKYRRRLPEVEWAVERAKAQRSK